MFQSHALHREIRAEAKKKGILDKLGDKLGKRGRGADVFVLRIISKFLWGAAEKVVQFTGWWKRNGSEIHARLGGA